MKGDTGLNVQSGSHESEHSFPLDSIGVLALAPMIVIIFKGIKASVQGECRLCVEGTD